MRLIDADELMEHAGRDRLDSRELIFQMINNAPTVKTMSDCFESWSDCFEPWDVLWKAPDGTFKGRCDNCGFVHVFTEGHVTQYKFCPQCGEQKQEL